MATINDAIKYGKDAVARGDLYIWGANGEKVLDLLPVLTTMETSTTNLSRVLTLLASNCKSGKDITKMRGFDCSGLWVTYLREQKILKSDMTADSLYKAINNPVDIKKIKAGDFLFHRSTGTTWTHVGMYIGNGKVIEAKGRLYGVVETNLGDYEWNGAARPKWWEEETKPATGKPVISRELAYIENNMMHGDDVKLVQEKLKCVGFNLGTADGIYGPKTEQAVIDFQVMNKLKKVKYGVVEAKTCKALGFEWKG